MKLFISRSLPVSFIILLACNNPTPKQSGPEFSLPFSVQDTINQVIPGLLQVRLRPEAVRMTFAIDSATRGLDRLNLRIQEKKTLDSLGLATVVRLLPRLEHKSDTTVIVYTEKAWREQRGKRPRSERATKAFDGVERDFIFTFKSLVHPDELSKIVSALPSVERSEVLIIPSNLIIPNDPDFAVQAGLHNPAPGSPTQVANFDIDAPDAWDIHRGDASVVVAVLDADIQVQHPDLYEKIWINTDELPAAFVTAANAASSDAWPSILTFTDLSGSGAAAVALRTTYSLTDTNGNTYIDGEDLLARFSDGVDSDANGYVDDIVGWNFLANSRFPWGPATHGTGVAGLVGARPDNALHVAGVGWNTRIMPISSNGRWTNVDYAIENGASMMTSSLAPNSGSPELDALLEELNTNRIPFTASLGNVDRYIGGTVFAESPYTIAVSNFSSTGVRTGLGGSSYSVNTDVAAPGTGVFTLSPTGSMPFDGTSASNPIVAGTLSLLMSRRPGLSPEQYRQIIRKSAFDIPSITGDRGENTVGFDYYSGFGLIKANAALTASITNPWAEAKLTTQGVSYWAANRQEVYHIPNSTEAVNAFAGIPASSSNVRLEWAPGRPPSATSWTTLANSSRPYVNDANIGMLDRTVFPNGISTLKLTVANGGVNFFDFGRIDMPRAFMDLKNNTLFRSDNNSIRGFAFHHRFRSYELQVAPGADADETNPGIWTTLSTSTVQAPPVAGGYYGLADRSLFESIPISSFPDEGINTALLRVKDAANVQLASYKVPIEVDKTVFPYLYGFPAEVELPYRFSGPTTYDLDGDGRLETIVTNQYQVYVYKEDGTPLRGWPVSTDATSLIMSSPSVGDITGDGLPEVVVKAINRTTREDKIFVYSRSGTALTPWPLELELFSGNCGINPYCDQSPFIDYAPVLADLDSDGDLEIVVAGKSTLTTGPAGIFAYQADGSLWRSYTVDDTFVSNYPPVVGDLDGDGELDIVGINRVGGPGSTYRISAWRSNGTSMFTATNSFPLNTNAHGVAIADMDNDSDLEIIVNYSNRLQAFHHNGDFLSGWSEVALPGLSYSMSLGNLDPSTGAAPSVIVPQYNDIDPGSRYNPQARITAVNPDGTLVGGAWETPVTMGEMAHQPIVMNIDADAQREILAGTYRQYSDGALIDPPYTSIYARNHDGTPVADNNYPVYVEGILPRCPVVADIDRNGYLELAIASNAWGAPLEVFALTAPDAAGAVAWGMQLHDPQRTSNYHGGIRLVEPTKITPSDVGSPTDATARQTLLVRLINELPYGAAPTTTNVAVRINGVAATVSRINRVEGEWWLLVDSPAQPTVGLFGIEVTWMDGNIRRVTSQKEAVRYSNVTDATDQALVIDRSFSMNAYEKFLAARIAGNFYVSSRGNRDQVGLVTFNTEASVFLDNTLLGNNGSPGRISVANRISNTPLPSGSTSIGAGLRRALTDLIPARAPGRRRAMVLVSDGLENMPPFWEIGTDPVNRLFERPENDDIIIHTIAIGPDADRDLQGRIATATGGTTRYVYLGHSWSIHARLSDAHMQVSEMVNNEQRIFTTVDSLLVSRAGTYTISVPERAQTLTFAVNFTNPKADVSITKVIRPDGTDIISTATKTTSPSSMVLKIVNPVAGNYTIVVSPGAANSEVLTTASVSTPDKMLATIAWPGLSGWNAMDAHLLASVFADPPRNSVLNISASIVDPDKQTTTIALYDDGLHRDGRAGDGVFGAPVALTKGGAYMITVRSAPANKQGAAMERTIGFFQPRGRDRDLDRIADVWELQYFINIETTNPLMDHDRDGLNAFEEFRYRTSPLVPDSDGDGMPDGDEVNNGTDPLKKDERKFTSLDKNGDGIPDLWQKKYFPGSDIKDLDALADGDADGLSMYTEWKSGTNPTRIDSDGDGLTDKEEADLDIPSPSVRTQRVAQAPPPDRNISLVMWSALIFLVLIFVVLWMRRAGRVVK